MALKRMTNLELISEKDAAVLSIDPIVLKEGEDPFVFIFRPHTDLSIRKEYLKYIAELQSLLKTSDESNAHKIISKLSNEERFDFMEKATEIQFKVIELLLLGYREKIGGEVIEKNKEILEIIRENDVIGEFYTKIGKLKSDVVDKKKS